LSPQASNPHARAVGTSTASASRRTLSHARNRGETIGTMDLRLNVCLVAMATLYAQALSGCAAPVYLSDAYAAVPVQLVVAPHGQFEVLDRPDLGRLTITPIGDERTRWPPLAALVREILPAESANAIGSISPGSAYFEPLMQYFHQTGRACGLIRGRHLVYAQYEFTYSCSPGFDPRVITWRPAGYSNAPIPPIR
jgi:hypothetical protein